ncbi:MAG: glucokinase [Rhodoferax sp.]|nr:glucokinase [Rhodoferax sp.]
MNQGFPRLLGDVGGTNARWAWQRHANDPLQCISVSPCKASTSLYDSAARYMEQHSLGQPSAASIGIATAVTGDRIQFTNNDWSFSIADLKSSLQVERCLVINDFTALALSLPALGEEDLMPLGGGAATANAPMALIGPGTGLGVSGLLPDGRGGWNAVSGEGGHVTLAATDALETSVLEFLRRQFGHASAERVLSGPGLVNLYSALCEVRGEAALDLAPHEITQAARAEGDAACQQALTLFASFLGNVAGNLALTLGTRGGVYVGGGIVPQLGDAFDAKLFRQKFEEKGRFGDYLRPIPAWLITASTPALIGASRALDVLKS